jgi:molybdate transport system substrate-binding protein
VYRTDAQTSLDRVSVVTIPPEINVIAEYPIAVVSGAAHPELARARVELVHSADGQRALREAGLPMAAGSDTKL